MITNLAVVKPRAVVVPETTGVDAQSVRIIEIGILKLRPGFEPDYRTQRMNSGNPIPAGATEVYNVRDADVAGLETM